MQEPQPEAEPENEEKQEQPEELHCESSKGRFKPITFPGSSASPGSNPPSSTRSRRGSAQEPATNTTNTTAPDADVKPAPQPDSAAPKSTPSRRRDSTELAAKESAPANNAVGTNGSAEQSGSKRKRPVIVFDPQPAAASDSPPQKRDKVELVVGVATEVTCSLRINGLKRPLREADLKAILEETGCATASHLPHALNFSADTMRRRSLCYCISVLIENVALQMGNGELWMGQNVAWCVV